jgi:hypothetical protein
LIGFFPTEGQGAIGALDYPDKERIKLARASLAWSCDKCGSHNATALPPRPDDAAAANASDLLKQSGVDVSEIKISKIVNIDEPDPASLPASAPTAVAAGSAAETATSTTATATTPSTTPAGFAAPVQTEPNVLPERSDEPVVAQQQRVQAQQQRESHGGAFSATQLFVYLLVTCIVALVLRKLLVAQGAPRVPIA